ncbi:MAG: hypothetical protein ACXVB0_14135 [Mucilaginibacter sp.]
MANDKNNHYYTFGGVFVLLGLSISLLVASFPEVATKFEHNHTLIITLIALLVIGLFCGVIYKINKD